MTEEAIRHAFDQVYADLIKRADVMWPSGSVPNAAYRQATQTALGNLGARILADGWHVPAKV